MAQIDPKILEKLEYVSKYVGTETNDWIRVKKELLNTISPKLRSHFSRRHKTSKKHFLNDFEKELIKIWYGLTGVQLKIEDSRLHQASDERPPRYWALMELNKQRQEKASNEQK